MRATALLSRQEGIMPAKEDASVLYSAHWTLCLIDLETPDGILNLRGVG